MATEHAKPPPVAGQRIPMLPTGVLVDEGAAPARTARRAQLPCRRVLLTHRPAACFLLGILVASAAAIVIAALLNSGATDTSLGSEAGSGRRRRATTSDDVPADPASGSGSDNGTSTSDTHDTGSGVWEALQRLRLQEVQRDTATVNASIALGTPAAIAQAGRMRVDADMARYSGEVSYPNMERQPALPYTNVGYAALGYDLLAGFPFPADGSVDPGFRRRIFDVTYRHRNVSSSGRLIPDGFEVVEEPSADFSFSYHMLSSGSDLKSLTDTAWSIKGEVSELGLDSASFAHNEEYKTTSDNARNQESMSSVTMATVKAYRAAVITPSLTPGFKAAVRAVQAGGADSALALLQAYGTHYVAEVQMGGRSTQTVTVSATSMATTNTANTKSSWEAGAKASFEAISGSVAGSHSSNAAREMRGKAGSKDASFKATFTGGVPSLGQVDIAVGGSGDDDDGGGEDSVNMEGMSAWASSVASHPVPVHYSLSLITNNLLTRQNFPDLTPSDVALIRRLLDSALLEYCGSPCADQRDADVGEVGLVRYGDLVTITSHAGNLGAGLGNFGHRCTAGTPAWNTRNVCTGPGMCGWGNSTTGTALHWSDFGCPGGTVPIFLEAKQGGVVNGRGGVCTITGGDLDPALMTLLQRNRASVSIGWKQDLWCTGGSCSQTRSQNYWEIGGNYITATQPTVSVVWGCMPPGVSTMRLLSPVPLKNLARRPVLGGESVVIAMRKGVIAPAIGENCGMVNLTNFTDLNFTDPTSFVYTVMGVPAGLPFTTGTAVRFGSNIAASPTSGCPWHLWSATMPALLMNTTATVSAASPALGTWLVPTNVAAIVRAHPSPLPNDNLTIARDVANAARAVPAPYDPSQFMAFDWTVVSESAEATAQRLGFSSAPVSFQFSYSVVWAVNATVSLFGDLLEPKKPPLVVDVNIEFSTGVFLWSNRDNQYVTTSTGPQPALFASDFNVTLTNQTDGCQSVGQLTESNSANASAVWFEQGGRQPATYSLRVRFDQLDQLWPRCLLVIAPPNTQEATGRTISEVNRFRLQPFELVPATLTWLDGSEPIYKIANITFARAVLNADLAPPQPYDFVASLNGEAVKPVSVRYKNPPESSASRGVINMWLAVEVPPPEPGAGDGSDIKLAVGQKRLRTASSPATWLSPLQIFQHGPGRPAARLLLQLDDHDEA